MATQVWDEHGNPVASATAPKQSWDEHGNPVTQPAAAPAAAPAAEPSALGRGARAGIESFSKSWGVDPAKVGEQPGLFGKIKEAGKEAGSSLVGSIKSEWQQPTVGGPEGASTPMSPGQSTAARILFPFHLVARGAENIAGGLERSAKDISTGTPEGIGAGIGEFLGAKSQVAAPEHVQRAFKSAVSLIERQPTVEQGKIGHVNAARQAVARLDNAVRSTGVGARAQQVIEADKLDNARTQSAGKVNTTDAVLQAQKVVDKTKLGGVPGGYPAQLSMDNAKALITQLGREASRLDRTGKAPEAAAVWAEYDGLRKATQERADSLGPEHGKAWRDYIAEHKSYMQLHNGLLGHITEGEHTTAFNKLIEHAGQLPELQKWFDKYNVDMSPVRDAATEGKKLQELTQQSSNAVMGKIKLLSRHWALGLPALAGAHAGSAALGLGGGIGGFIIPLIIAGKVGGLLDTMQVKALLHDLKSKLPPEQFQVAPSPIGPIEQLHTAASSPPAGEGFKGGINPQGTETLMSGKQSTAASSEALVRDLQKAAAEGTPEEKTAAKARLAEMGESEAPAKFVQSRADIAKQVKSARSVYHGKR